ncbi:MAG: tetratricopeptide repeat protein [Gammaproteobacteria bacterium]|nr:tetratricopeptide repeat protein [Gammaproteobacteria bacterium]
MKIKILCVALLSPLLLFACSTVSRDKGSSKENQETAISKTSDDPQATTSIPPKLLYSILVAEIALKRGELDIAVEYYLQAARDTRDPEIAKRATRIAEFSQSNVEALESAKLWTDIDPKNREARQALVILLLRDKKLNEALPQLETLISNAGEDQELALMQLVAQLSREKDKEAAIELMERLVKKQSNNAFAHFAFSHLNTRSNRLEQAMISVDQALQIKSDWLDAMVLRARILQLQGKNEEAVGYYEAQIAKGATNIVNLRTSFARMLMDVKDLNKAREQYVILSELQPDNDDLVYAAGLLSLQADKTDDAEKFFKRLHKQKSRKIEASFYLGQVAESNNKFEEAAQWYSEVSRGELYIDAQMRIAALLSKQKQFDKAIDSIRSIRVSSSGDKLKLYLLEGDVVLDAGRYREAFDIYNRALRDMPDESNLLYARALAAEKIDRLDILEDDLRSILKSEPNNVQALNALGYTLADRTERYDEALFFIKRAFALEPKDAAVVDSMGWVHYRLGNHKEALIYLKAAMDIIGDVEIAAHFGEVLWVTNRKKEAIEVWNQALEESPNNNVILDVMRRFGL